LSKLGRIGIDARKLRDGGIGRYVRELLGALVRCDEAPELVALAPARERAAIAAIDPGIAVVEVDAPGYSLRELVAVAVAARRARLDLLHLPHYPLPFRVPCPVVVTVHDLIHLRVPRSQGRSVYARWMLGRVRRRAAVVLSPSQATARDLVDRLGFASERVRVVPQGVPRSFVQPPPPAGDVERFRATRGLVEPYLLHVTNGLPHKGLDLLLRAWRDLEKVQLAIAGQGSGRDAVRARIATEPASIRARVVVLGELAERDLVLAYRGARAVVAPSLLEGFGFPALEAMAAGTPVVASDAGGLPEVIGDAGMLFPAGCVDKLKDAIYMLFFAIDCAQREGLIRRGFERARRFSWESAARATLQAYEAALGAAA